jgi:L-seryl-tRNA(Ser) seleniumtransferase
MRENQNTDPRARLGLRRVINAAGTMTVLGSSAALPEVVTAAAAILPWFVEIDDLQRAASATIAEATGGEAGFVSASASAAITLAIAGAMTGADPQLIARLPDATGMKRRVIVQRGHLVNYGAPMDQAIRLAGAVPVPIGNAAGAEIDDLAAALDAENAAALYVVSHHVACPGQIPLAPFARSCRARGVPVIVDAASEYDLTGFLANGADVAIYSAHKFLAGLTAGIVAGRKHLVRAAYLQNLGIGRGMKVGKEGIAGAMAALQAWASRDHAARRRCEAERVALWRERLSEISGIRVEPSPDPTGNPVTRLRVSVLPESGTTAWTLADALAAGERPVSVRDDEIERGYFELDPCNVRAGEAEEIADRLLAELSKARRGLLPPVSYAVWNARRTRARLAWPDRPEEGRG